jgi:N-succinyldiaminopimelate aminotransferase
MLGEMSAAFPLWQSIQSEEELPFNGVVQVMREAAVFGYDSDAPDWLNLGQGQPEVGEIPGAPPRVRRLDLTERDSEYGPLNGCTSLRLAVADFYNRTYRAHSASKYSAENVAIVAGGRLALSRVFAAFSGGNFGYHTPDYPAFEDILHRQRERLSSVPLRAASCRAWRISAEDLDRAMQAQNLSGYVFSNPCNPTGELVEGDELGAYVRLARRRQCLLIVDEFYSQYVFKENGGPAQTSVSAAGHLADVEQDPVVIVDGLTKNFRYPGWRIAWVVGPRQIIDALARVASSLDGGAPVALQGAAVEVVGNHVAGREGTAIREHFAAKRSLMRGSLQKLGLTMCGSGRGTFYVWASVADLPPHVNTARKFVRIALDQQVIVVPGDCFDLEPGRPRARPSELETWVRFSFGPESSKLIRALDRLRSAILVEPHTGAAAFASAIAGAPSDIRRSRI